MAIDLGRLSRLGGMEKRNWTLDNLFILRIVMRLKIMVLFDGGTSYPTRHCDDIGQSFAAISHLISIINSIPDIFVNNRRRPLSLFLRAWLKS